MERRSGTRWPFVIFLLFLCPALVSLAGESQVKLCQWCCVYCCCYLYFFPGCCFYYWCYYFFFPCCCCLYFPASLLSFNDTFVVVFVLFLAVYLPDVGNCHFFLFVICCPFLFLLFFLLFTFLIFINFASKPHYLSLKKIGQNFAFSLLKGTPAWRNTLFATYISFGCLLFAPECDIFSITDPSLVSFNLSRTLLNIRLLIGIFRFSFSCRWLLCRPVQPHLNICKQKNLDHNEHGIRNLNRSMVNVVDHEF